jgi:protein-arginine kinase activator protein McsA
MAELDEDPEIDEDMELETCPHCGKAFEDFSEIGCGHCDRRSPEWGTV